MSNALVPEMSYDYYVAELKRSSVTDDATINNAIASLKSEDAEVVREAKTVLFNSVSMYAVKLVNNAIPTNTELRKEGIQEAFITLWKGMDNFNPSRAKFITFASNYIRKGILKTLDSFQYPELTHNYVDNIRKVDKYISKFEFQHGRTPTDQEISDGTGLSMKSISDVSYNRSGSTVTNIFYEEEFATVVDIA